MLTRLHGVSDIVSPVITALSEPWRHNTAALPTAAALMRHYGNLISRQTFLALHSHIYHLGTTGIKNGGTFSLNLTEAPITTIEMVLIYEQKLLLQF